MLTTHLHISLTLFTSFNHFKHFRHKQQVCDPIRTVNKDLRGDGACSKEYGRESVDKGRRVRSAVLLTNSVFFRGFPVTEPSILCPLLVLCSIFDRLI